MCEDPIRTEAVPVLVVKVFPCHTPRLIDNIGSWAGGIRVARIQDIVGSNHLLVFIYDQGIRDFKGLLRCIDNREWVRADSDQFCAFGLNFFITRLQLSELRSAGASCARAIEDDDEFLPLVL